MRKHSLVLLGLLVALPAGTALPAHAQDVPGGEHARHERAQDAGSAEGRVRFVDHVHGRILLDTPRGPYDIVVLPSTTIVERGGEYHTIADIRRGQRVQVFLSKREGSYFAQIIRLHGER
jgi:hypothetical protein